MDHFDLDSYVLIGIVFFTVIISAISMVETFIKKAKNKELAFWSVITGAISIIRTSMKKAKNKNR